MPPVLPAAEVIGADFDRIARLTDPDRIDRWGAWVVERVPAGCAVLDVGCGTGAVARRLAAKAERVVALDVSAEMVRVARRCSAMHGNLELERADFVRWPVPVARFDAVVSIATLHHLPMREGLARLADAVKPGGLLLVVDLLAARGLLEVPYNLASATSRILTGNRRPRGDLAAAWRAHEAHDRHEPMSTIRRTVADVLPAARVRRHLGWRYSLEWHAPAWRPRHGPEGHG